MGIIFCTTLWIGQYVIGLLQQEELSGIAGDWVVRVKAGRQKSLNAVDCVGLRIGADLKELVVIWNFHRVLPRRTVLY